MKFVIGEKQFSAVDLEQAKQHVSRHNLKGDLQEVAKNGARLSVGFNSTPPAAADKE